MKPEIALDAIIATMIEHTTTMHQCVDTVNKALRDGEFSLNYPWMVIRRKYTYHIWFDAVPTGVIMHCKELNNPKKHPAIKAMDDDNWIDEV